MGFVADNLGKQMDKLPEGLQRTFRKYDITQEDLDVMSSVGAFQERGATFMRPDDLFEANRQTAFKYLEMIQFETDLAVPVASIRAQATLQGGTRPGTIIGSLSRSVAQYKSFPITFMLNNLRQMTNLDGSKLNKGLLATELLVTSTLMAGVSIQLREITKGRDPILSSSQTVQSTRRSSALLSLRQVGLASLVISCSQRATGLAAALRRRLQGHGWVCW